MKYLVKSIYRGKETQNENQALLKIQGVNDRKSSAYYFGKRVAYVYKAHNTVRNTKYRVLPFPKILFSLLFFSSSRWSGVESPKDMVAMEWLPQDSPAIYLPEEWETH